MVQPFHLQVVVQVQPVQVVGSVGYPNQVAPRVGPVAGRTLVVVAGLAPVVHPMVGHPVGALAGLGAGFLGSPVAGNPGQAAGLAVLPMAVPDRARGRPVGRARLAVQRVRKVHLRHLLPH